LPVIAQALGVGIEDLVSASVKPAKRGSAPKIQQQLERVSQLPRARQRMVSKSSTHSSRKHADTSATARTHKARSAGLVAGKSALTSSDAYFRYASVTSNCI
jgi:hypothetical protein